MEGHVLERPIIVEVYERKYQCVYDSETKRLLLGWMRDTSAGNFFWFRWVTLGFTWPFIRYLSGFCNTD